MEIEVEIEKEIYTLQNEKNSKLRVFDFAGPKRLLQIHNVQIWRNPTHGFFNIRGRGNNTHIHDYLTTFQYRLRPS